MKIDRYRKRVREKERKETRERERKEDSQKGEERERTKEWKRERERGRGREGKGEKGPDEVAHITSSNQLLVFYPFNTYEITKFKSEKVKKPSPVTISHSLLFNQNIRINKPLM